jgi:hypothetical protein
MVQMAYYAPPKDRIVASKFLKEGFFKVNMYSNKVICRMDRWP